MSHPATEAEKRNFSRIAFDSPVTLKQTHQSWQSSLIDISLKGVLIQKPEGWNESADNQYKLEISLNEGEAEIDMDVKLAHSEDGHMGFHCEQIDVDSISRLKRLVELNLGDEALLDREISNMLEQ